MDGDIKQFVMDVDVDVVRSVELVKAIEDASAVFVLYHVVHRRKFPSVIPIWDIRGNNKKLFRLINRALEKDPEMSVHAVKKLVPLLTEEQKKKLGARLLIYG